MSTPNVVAVSRSASHGFSKDPEPSITLIAGEGVDGDAHCGATTQHVYLKRLTPDAPNLAQVHLLSAELLDEFAAAHGLIAPGELGENILTRHLDLLALPLHTQLAIGDCILQVTGLRTPCKQIDRFRPGLQQALWGPRDATGKRTRRAGIMTTVLRGGVIHPTDAIHITLPQQPHLPLPPV